MAVCVCGGGGLAAAGSPATQHASVWSVYSWQDAADSMCSAPLYRHVDSHLMWSMLTCRAPAAACPIPASQAQQAPTADLVDLLLVVAELLPLGLGLGLHLADLVSHDDGLRE